MSVQRCDTCKQPVIWCLTQTKKRPVALDAHAGSGMPVVDLNGLIEWGDPSDGEMPYVVKVPEGDAPTFGIRRYRLHQCNTVSA